MINRLFIILLSILCTGLAAQSDDVFTRSADLIDQHREGLLFDYEGISNQLSELDRLSRILESGQGHNDDNSLGYHVLAYNLFCISSIASNYPIQSIKQIANFYDQELLVNGKEYTLTTLESYLVDKYEHGAIHFLLTCGTMGSPPLPIHDLIKPDKAYLDGVLKSVLNNRLYAYVNLPNRKINLSSIFDQHQDDFGGIKRIIDLIESYNTISLREYDLKFDIYDWTINDIKHGQLSRYLPTRLLTKSEVEFRIFENYYTQVDPNPSVGPEIRSSYLNHLISLSVGTNKNLNWGFVMRLRSVNVHSNRSIGTYFGGVHFISEQKSFNNSVESYRRFGLTAIGPQIKYRPKLNLKGKSLFVHTLTLPIGKELEGNSSQGFLDWSGYSLYNQWLYDFDINNKSNLYFDTGLHLENIDLRIFNQDGGYVLLSAPVSVFYHYYPAPKWTLYLLGTAMPRIALQNKEKLEASFEPLGQIGGGIRRFISETIELELLITQVLGGSVQRKAQTVNLGFRYNY